MENVNLSWWDKNIIPRSKEYKDFIRDYLSNLYLSSEEFFEDGERDDISEEYSTREKKFIAIYEFREINKNSISLESHPYTIGVLVNNEFKDKYTSYSPLGAVDLLMNYKDEILRIVNNIESTSFIIQNKSEAFAAISDFWGRELTKQSDLSKGLSYTNIDENHSYYFNRHLFEENKLNLSQEMDNVKSKTLSSYQDNVNKKDSNKIITGSTNDEKIYGTITFHDSGEVVNYTSPTAYLKALEIEFDFNPGGFTHQTIIETPELLKRVDDLIYNLYGDINPKTLSSYQHNVNSFDIDSNPLTSFENDSAFIDNLFEDIDNRVGDIWQKKQNDDKLELIGGKISDIAADAILNPDSLKIYDQNTQNVINLYNHNEILMENIFKIENFLLSKEQKEGFEKYLKTGDENSEMQLTIEQNLKIPDRFRAQEITNIDKIKLANKVFEHPDFHLAIEDNCLLITNSDEIREPLNNSEIFFKNTNNQNLNIMENSENNQKKAINQLEVGKIASVNSSDGFFKGKIDSISGDSATIKNLKGEQKEFNKKDVYQFFPGQKYDKSEIETLFKNKPGGIGFTDVEKSDLTKLMRGELTNTVYHGSKTQENGEEKNYSFKLRPMYSSEDKKIKITPEWKNNKDIDWNNLQKFGKQISPEQVEKLKSGKPIVLDIDVKIHNKPEYSVKLHFDKDLNNIVFDGFVNGKRPELSDNLQMQKEPLKKDFKDRFAYEEWLTNDVNIFDNATKVNLHQLNKMFLVIDETELHEFLTDFSIESKKIDVVLSSPDIIKGDDKIENLKSEILSDINSSSEKVDLFKEKFKSLYSGNTNNNNLKR